MTPEAKVKRVVTKQLKEMGAYYFFPATGGYGRSGVPDIVGCWEGAQLVANEDNAAGVTKWLEGWKRKRQLPEWYRSVVDVTEGE